MCKTESLKIHLLKNCRVMYQHLNSPLKHVKKLTRYVVPPALRFTRTYPGPRHVIRPVLRGILAYPDTIHVVGTVLTGALKYHDTRHVVRPLIRGDITYSETRHNASHVL